MSLPASPRLLRATYRLQLRGGVGLREAATLASYLRELGVSHLYVSPLLRARSGSPHGYDVVEPDALDPQLGDASAFDRFVAALRAQGLGWILDFVPNHVGIAGGENPWWWDVLEHGRASRFADFFDIDWEPGAGDSQGRVLQPFLGASLDEVLARGEITLLYDADRGALVFRYHEHRFPLRPDTTSPLLREARAELGDEADAAQLGHASARLGGPRLRQLLSAQHYRLASWREASTAINYRRFFDVSDLAALRMERSEVFERAHRLVFRWLDEGRLDGLRLDHVDGLLDPAAYCRRLRQRLPRAPLLVEKILADGEALRADWPVDGTTGYEFLNLLTGLLVDPAAAPALERLYHAFTAREPDFARVGRAARRQVLGALFGSERDRLCRALEQLAGRDPRAPRAGAEQLRGALEALLAVFPVYRTYVDGDGAREEDERILDAACEQARRHAPELDAGPLDWLRRVLAGVAPANASASLRGQVLDVARRFQQLSAPLAAKGIEDTAFYRHHVLLALNEVGGDPGRFGISAEAFHAANGERAREHPCSLLATATHDTKRGEDVRARLAVLSELPDAWEQTLQALHRAGASLREELDGEWAPAAGDAYLLYQTLLGSWPLDAGDLDAYTDRIEAYLVKALREAKERSSWRDPDPRYEAACLGFVRRALAPDSVFRIALQPFAARVAAAGALNGLAQLALKFTAPGVPDLYQGCELWDLSLVDPDNRRPVDFGLRRQLLAELRERAAGSPGELARELLGAWQDGRIKLFVTARLLELRASLPGLFAEGAYLPLELRGERAGHAVAFARTAPGALLVVAVPRLAARLPRTRGDFPLGRGAWGDTEVHLPASLATGPLRDAIVGGSVEPRQTRGTAALRVAELFDVLPLSVAVGAPAGAD